MTPKSYKEKISLAARWIANSKHFVIFTGAGISTESGIPDYRGPDGVWTRRDKGLPPPKAKKPWHLIEPNTGHLVLVELQKMGILKYLVSQNVDNLHLQSGIKSEILAELHGNHSLMRCLSCDTQFPKKKLWDENIWGNGYRTQPVRANQPKCPNCYGRIISSVVNFEDPMPKKELEASFSHAEQSDVCLVIGSSLMVEPAASVPKIAKKFGSKLIILNQMATGLDHLADLRFHESAGETLEAILKEIKKSLM